MRSVSFALVALSVWAFFSAAPVTAAPAGDIVTPGSGITLGTGWYLHENGAGGSFRWVANDAQFIVNRPTGSVKKIAITAEPGPGLGETKMTLHVLDRNGKQVASAVFNGKQRQRFDLGVTPGQDSLFVLRVDGGGKRVPHDPRTLNFRVFSIDDASSDAALGAGHPDIAGPGITLSDNWYPLEEYNNQTFRWVNNDARFDVTSAAAQTKRLKVLLAPGPGLTKPSSFDISLRDASGKEIQKATVHGLSTIYLNLPLAEGSNRFSLHVDGGGKAGGAKGDTRTLDFRVFSLTVE
jgi:hypothetical protein